MNMRNGVNNPFGKHGKTGFGPIGGSKNPIPSNNELRWCAWGFLMASVWFADTDREPPSKKYIEALAELRGLRVPVMAEAGEYFVEEFEPCEEVAGGKKDENNRNVSAVRRSDGNSRYRRPLKRTDNQHS